MSDWVETDEIPGGDRKPPGRPRLELAPGQKRYRVVGPRFSSDYEFRFQAQGRTDYHACVRTVDGERRLYIWRDEVKNEPQ